MLRDQVAFLCPFKNRTLVVQAQKTTPKGGFFVERQSDQAALASTALKVWLGHITALSLLVSGR